MYKLFILRVYGEVSFFLLWAISYFFCKNMQKTSPKRNPMTKVQLLSIILNTFLLLTQTLQASGIKIDTLAPKNHQPTLIKAPNKVPVINIVKPNSRGFSHNIYKGASNKKR